MAKSNNFDEIKNDLQDYANKLKEDLNSKKPSVFAAVVWAYQNEEVRKAIAERLVKDEVLVSSVQIVPDRALRRERVYFDFSPRGRFDEKLPGILVQIKDDNSVAEIINPFDSYGPNTITAANAADTFPLFATRGSEKDHRIVINSEAQEKINAGWSHFVAQVELARLINRGGFGGLGGTLLNNVVVTGGTPTSSTVASETGRKEDPDADTTGGTIDSSFELF
jgi:hypothetical protein